MLKKMSIGLVVIAFLLCLGLWFTHYNAWQESVAESELNCRLTGICLSASGPNTYEFLADRYAFILFFLLFFLAGQFFQPKVLSLSVCLSSVFLILYQFWQINQWYSLLISMPRYNTEPFFNLLHNAVLYIWISLSIISALAIIQVVSFLKPQVRK